MSAIERHQDQAIGRPDFPIIQNAIDIVVYSLSETSKRQYFHSFKEWRTFCERQNIAVTDLRAQNLIAFLEQRNLAHKTRQARLTHMRRLLQALHAEFPDNPDIRSMYEQAQLLRVKHPTKDEVRSERREHRLSREQVYRILNYFDADTKLHARNRAILALLLYCGLRRAELVKLQWQDIDLDQKLLTVRHGKGDKRRTIPILDGLHHIEKWYAIAGQRRYVCCGFRKGDHLAEDRPMKTNAVWVIVKDLETGLGLGGLSPHDFRRTLLTSLINEGTPINVAQAIAGHANPQTTLHYAEIADAEEMRTRAKLAY